MYKMSEKVVKGLKMGALCSLILVSTVACTDDEVRVGVGAAAIGAGALIIGDAIDGRDDYYNGRRGDYRRGRRGRYECVGGRRNVCESYRDYYGNIRRNCRTVFDACASRRWSDRYLVTNDLLSNVPSDVSSVEWAKTFQMSHKSAVKMITAFNEARSGKGQKLAALGLDTADLRSLSKYDMPSDVGIDRLGKNLNQRSQDTKVMIAKLIESAKSVK